jgi:thiol-disulfide isomerase/thioredoxin
MPAKKSWPMPLLIVLVAAAVVIAVISTSTRNNPDNTAPDANATVRQNDQQNSEKTTQNHGQTAKTDNTTAEQNTPTEQNTSATNQPTLDQIAQKATWWSPTKKSWYGKSAPNFSLKDLSGNTHSLNDYKGKKVLVVVWATWCPPCKMEIPHLTELRKEVPKDKLAILALNTETDQPDKKIKDFVERTGINYTVLRTNNSLPAPYAEFMSIPAAVFIDPQQNIKYATIGALSTDVILDIFEAEK